MAADEHDLAQLHELFDAEIRRLDQVLAEREKQVNVALAASQKAVEKADTEAERARQSQNEWRGAMNDREAQFVRLDQFKAQQIQLNAILDQQNVGRGRQTAWVAAAGIIATILAIGVGQIIRQGITSADVSQQIQREAPWNRDKAQVERRITILEGQVQHNQVLIAKLQSDLQALIIEHKNGGR